ncbi:MAG: MarR family transcriptional regulator [Pseudomonadota bacterium]
MDEAQAKAAQIFALFNEIGIISQLSRAQFDAHLPDGFSVQHFSVLNHLLRVKNGQTPLALARAFQVPKNTMTHTLGGLERAGLVALKPNPDDGRSKQVWISDEGRTFRDQAIASLVPSMMDLLPVLADVDVEKLVGDLVRIRTYLDAARDN